MAFQPEKITKEDVLKAAIAIDNDERPLRPSTKFDVIVNGKPYPPKDLMRLAHKNATGEYLWKPGGGPPTNKYLTNLGFKVVGKGEQSGIKENPPDIKEFFNRQPKVAMKNETSQKYPLNQILYGPPGTGKTYHTINRALEIIGEDLEGKSRAEIKKLINAKVKEEQIVFTTFHQSLGYEDFIEGIKPVTENATITYEVQDGIFKQICEKAKPIKSQTKNFDWSNRRFFKMSLGGKQEPEIHNYCLKEDRISLGWGGLNDLSKMEHIKSWTIYSDEFKSKFPTLVEKSLFHIQASWRFLSMKKGDIVVATMGNHIVDAIGVVEGDYEFIDDNQLGYPHERKVNWLVKNLNTTPDRFFKKKISQQTIYEFYSEDIKVEAFEELTNTKESRPKNYVIVIDEINRGNVSQIFGELITLIEEDKRLGNKEGLLATLPYSKQNFGVPANLYIIGTMNTADRSVEALDTALRRRFDFVEMAPRPDLLNSKQLIIDLWNAEKYSNHGWDDEPYRSHADRLYTLLGVDKGLEKKYRSTKKDDEPITTPWETNDLDHISSEDFKGINFELLLETINRRIEKLIDKDHCIGHSFFLNLSQTENPELELRNIFQNKIMPLLQEYFFGDLGKIELVIGERFFKKPTKISFAKNSYEDSDILAERNVYKFEDVKNPDFDLISAVKEIYQ